MCCIRPWKLWCLYQRNWPHSLKCVYHHNMWRKMLHEQAVWFSGTARPLWLHSALVYKGTKQQVWKHKSFDSVQMFWDTFILCFSLSAILKLPIISVYYCYKHMYVSVFKCHLCIFNHVYSFTYISLKNLAQELFSSYRPRTRTYSLKAVTEMRVFNNKTLLLWFGYGSKCLPKIKSWEGWAQCRDDKERWIFKK